MIQTRKAERLDRVTFTGDVTATAQSPAAVKSNQHGGRRGSEGIYEVDSV